MCLINWRIVLTLECTSVLSCVLLIKERFKKYIDRELFTACLLTSSSWSVGTQCQDQTVSDYVAKVICLFERLQ